MNYSVPELEYFMREALLESKKALPACRPNPPVGCVMVVDGAIIARGFTQPPGLNHAEIHALEQLESTDGVMAVVTLEPCSFVGRTPSCARTFTQTNIKSVLVGMIDPDPRNNGKGIKIMEDAGIEVITNILHKEVAEFLSPFLLKE
jgi:pyrimidine deaminase RibD-like protein